MGVAISAKREGDPNIFKPIIAPLYEVNPHVTCESLPQTTSLSNMDVFVQKMTKHLLISNF